ncbi:MAG: L-lactate permease, partial [Polaromonas sp.]|nr:L-lactate permease [Polaromonas sp.]
PVLAQVALTGLDAVAIAWRTALLHAMLGGLLMLFFMRVLATGVNAGKPDQAREVLPIGWPVLAAGGFLLPSLALAALLGPELATLGGALAGAAIFIAVLRWRSRGPANPGPAPGLGRALWPYGVLIALVLFTRAPPVSGLLASVKLHWQWAGGYGASMQPLVHPGTLLLLALLVGARLQHVPFKDVGSSLAHAARQLLPVSVALLAMLCLSRLMLHAGMIAALQDAAVSGLGHGWSLVAPAVGALGSFVTGSATASNVLFTSLQAQTAQALGLPVALMVAAQGFGAAIGNIVCPHNIIAGAATVGLAGREADILRHTLWPCALYLVAGGLLVTGLAIW